MNPFVFTLRGIAQKSRVCFDMMYTGKCPHGEQCQFSHVPKDFEHFTRNNALHFFRANEKPLDEAIKAEPNSKLAEFLTELRKASEDPLGGKRGPPRGRA